MNINNTRKQAPKPKPKVEGKNSHLFGELARGQAPKEDDRFTASSALKFTNSKGKADNLVKLQQQGPSYNPDLEDDALDNQAAIELEKIQETQKRLESGYTEEPLKFKGKLKAMGEETDADKQRAQFMKEINDRASDENYKALERAEIKEEKKEEERRFFSSNTGNKNFGLRMGEGETSEQPKDDG